MGYYGERRISTDSETMSEDFYPFVDSGDPAPDNRHLTGVEETPAEVHTTSEQDISSSGIQTTMYATRIAVYDDMLSTPRVIVVEPTDVRSYLEEITNTVYRCMKEQGGGVSLMVIREIVENFIHAHFAEPIISILDCGNTIRFADQGPGIADKERAFDFGVTSANRSMKRYIRGTGAGFPMVQQYLENSGGAVSIEDNMGQGTVVTVSIDAARVDEIRRNSDRGAAVRSGDFSTSSYQGARQASTTTPQQAAQPMSPYGQMPAQETYYQQGFQPVYPQAASYAQQNQFYPAWQQQPTQPYPAQPAPVQAWNPYTQTNATAGSAGTYQQAQATPPTGQVPYGTSQAPYGNPATMQSVVPQAGDPANQPMGSQAMFGATQPFISDRGKLALQFIMANQVAGPTELTRTLGNSVSTWSRELEKLAESGLIIKHGQKYHLTELGVAWTQSAAQ